MGIWSTIKNAAKKTWRVVKGVVRWAVKLVATVVMWAINIWDFLFGFLNWPQKYLTLHIVILSKIDPIDMKIVPVCQPSDLQSSIDQAERILRERVNVKLRPYAPQFAQILGGVAAQAALNPSCCGLTPAWEEFREQGEWYAGHTAGWVTGIPISLRFPITAFVVEDVQCKAGCAIGPTADYLVIDMDGVNSTGPRLNNSTLMHEIGHCCHLPHWFVGVQNLMWPGADRGDETKWWQRNLFRNSRHVTYW
jgi:hypothetical protein